MFEKKVVLLMSNKTLGSRIGRRFASANFKVSKFDDIEQVMIQLETEPPHALIVDQGLVNGGLEVLQQIIQDNCRKTILVVLTKNQNPEDRIMALELGADDVFDNPPDVETLVAKVKALVRRVELINDTPKSLRIKDIAINLDTHEVSKKGQPIDLTYTQFKLLYLLASHREYVFTRNEILDKVWGKNVYVTDRTVDVHVKRLREKLNSDNAQPKYIQTIHGLGYRFA